MNLPEPPIPLSYRKYLRSPEWKEKRQEVLNHYGNKCFICGTKAGSSKGIDIWGNNYFCVLEVHHMTYQTLGEEEMRDLIPLCKQKCHFLVHKLIDSYRNSEKYHHYDGCLLEQDVGKIVFNFEKACADSVDYHLKKGIDYNKTKDFKKKLKMARSKKFSKKNSTSSGL